LKASHKRATSPLTSKKSLIGNDAEIGSQFKLQEKSGAKGSNCYYVPQNVAHVAHSLSMAQSVAQDHVTKRSRYKEIQEM